MIVHSTAVRFATGSAPGCARQTGQVCVFSGAPKPVSQRQNIFVRVFRWTWISRPTTPPSRSRVRFSSLSLTRRAASAIASQSGMPSSRRLASSWDAFGSPG